MQAYNRVTVKIYTRTGDSGETGLFDGTRVAKSDGRVSAYGDVDELNAWLGLARAALTQNRVALENGPDGTLTRAEGCDPQFAGMLEQMQRDLFALGSRLADPRHKIAGRVTKAAISTADIDRLENWIDELESELPPLRRFILPGGSQAGAALHVARTICRRAERSIVALGELEPELLAYINRVSDLLFVMARAANHRVGSPELEW